VGDLRRRARAQLFACLKAGPVRTDHTEDVEHYGATSSVRQRVHRLRSALPHPRRDVTNDRHRLRVRSVHEAAAGRQPGLQQPVPHEHDDHVQPRRATDLQLGLQAPAHLPSATIEIAAKTSDTTDGRGKRRHALKRAYTTQCTQCGRLFLLSCLVAIQAECKI